ncbi:hypothetical protein V2J09_018131 [Rumex salicifolius]
MEELVPVNSGFEPVYIKLGSPESRAADREANRDHVKTVTVEVPLRFPTNSNPRRKGQEGEEVQQWEHQLNCALRSSFIQNFSNFKRSAEPEKLMYYKDGAWIEFSSSVVERAKVAFLQRNPAPEIDVDGNGYIFDFYRMLQIDVVNCAQRSLSWIDVNKRCYFPKLFVDDCIDTCDITKIEIEIKLENNLSRTKRKRGEGYEFESEDLDTADSSSVGESNKTKIQRVMEPKGLKWPNARLITVEERAFSAVRDLFLAGMTPYDSGVEITSIYQFNRAGAMEKARWEVFQKQMEITKTARGMEKTVFAWHGTSKQCVESILARGFELPSKVSDSQAYGTGVYLSSTRSPQLSHMLAEPDDNGERHIILCRVILGNAEKVEIGSQQCYPSSVNYDTGVDDVNNPKYYVVWSTNMNTHILPECVISYKCSTHRLQGSLQSPELFKWPHNEANPAAAKLFTELRQSLPPPKLEALQSLMMSYKVGGMNRNTFIKTLRSIAGDGMLRSIMPSRAMRLHGFNLLFLKTRDAVFGIAFWSKHQVKVQNDCN